MLEKKHIMLCRMIPTDSSQETEDYWQQKVEDYAWQLQSYWRYYNGHHWDYQVRGYVIRYDGLCDPPSVVYGKGWAEDATDEYIATHDMQGFEPNYRYVWGKTSKNSCGLAAVGGDRAMINGVQSPSTCGAGTMVHEGGHNYGYRHTGFLREDGTTTVYGDKTCVMGGGGAVIKGLCSPNMVMLNLDTLRERLTVEESQQVMLRPTEMPYHSLHENQYQHVVLKKSGYDDIYISIRKVKGTAFPVSRGYKGTIFAHVLQSDKSIKRIDPDMPYGSDKWVLPNGMVIEYLDYSNETALINILSEIPPLDGSVPYFPPVDIPQGFAPAIPSAEVTPEYNGAWFNRTFNGQGLDIHIHAGTQNKVVVYWYTFSSNGQPIYYIGVTDLNADGSPVEFELHRTTGGTWDDPTTYEYEDVGGTGKLYFLDKSRGVFMYKTNNYDEGSIEVTPTAPLTQNAWNGSWYDRSKDGSGFTVQRFDHMDNGDGTYSDRLSMFWYAYDNDGNQLWLTCQGYRDDMDLDIFEMEIYEVLNGEWVYPSNIDTNPCGVASAQFLLEWEEGSEDIIEFNYDLYSTKVEDAGTLTLNRLL